MALIDDLKNNLKFIAVKAIDSKVDGRELTRKLDFQLDEALGKRSEDVQRGPLSNLLMEMLEGLWDEDLTAFRMYLMGRVQTLPKPKE